MRKLKASLVHTAFGGLLVFSFWYVAHLWLDINVLPSPFAVFSALPDLPAQGIALHAWASAYRVFMALSFSILLGLSLGILAAGKHIVARGLNPFLYFTYPIPRVALLPVVLLIFGLSNLSQIIMIVLIVVYPIIIVVRDSVKEIPPQTYHSLRCYGASPVQVFFYITLPWALGSVLSTARISLGTALSILFFVEAYGTRRGMGFFILDAWMRLNYVQMYAGIVALSGAGFALFLLIDILESFALKWKKVGESHG